jgi:hypothetical protein
LSKRKWWRITDSKKEADFIWTPWQIASKATFKNHIKNHEVLTTKKGLFLSMKDKSYLPESFLVTKTSGWDSLFEFFTNLNLENRTIIVKPGEGSNRGVGIEVTNSLEKVKSIVLKSKKTYIVQKYIDDPLLISSIDKKLRKFDIRVFGLFT